ncbi:WD40 repeat-like protein [Annulohypoxylon truncatum]|uniref:WD40 repeat-like protein n=1 Tax=Annulohypoxylon truncatum TaxID=327061 RepID=UPI002008610B|nr:WD40 repeat-like protein [Annulohypoxylon truncatum]KAI1214306.1 WD40 repeat-like protein [Annulohypoxylon truncatum]
MSWPQVSAMGTGGNGSGIPGAGGQEMPGGASGNHSNQPHATEYTLQGVMRFLQTEWHRHERDRNAWEIERQEMKGRIAALEGSARRADATQKALKRYVTILEKKVKDQAAQLKVASSTPSATDHSVKQPQKIDRAALIQEKLKSSSEKPKEPLPGLEGLLGERVQEDDERENLRVFLDQCQAEFTYLMVTPANPMPPRESPPLPLMEEGDFGLPMNQQPLDAAFQALRLNQNHVKDPGARPGTGNTNNHHIPAMQQGHNVNLPPKNADLQSAPMVRSGEGPAPMYSHPGDWSVSGPPAARMQEDMNAKSNHSNESSRSEFGEAPLEKRGPTDNDAWDFGEGNFPDPASTQQLQPLTHRPDTDAFPNAENLPKSPNRGPASHRRKTSMSRRKSADQELSLNGMSQKTEHGSFKLRYGLRGHLNAVRSVIFSGGGSPGEPEICTAGDDGLIKRFHIPRETPGHLGNISSDLDVPADFTHRGHTGAVLSLTSWSPSPNFSTGGRAQGDGWIFSGGQDATIRVWERGRVDPKATLDGHSDAVWAICVLPATLGSVFGQTNPYGTPDRILVVSGAADGAVKIWAVSAPPQLTSPQPAPPRRGTGSGRVRGNSMSSGSQFPSSPQPNMASNSPFHYTLVHDIRRSNGSQASPTCITPLSASGETFVVSYSDAAIIVFDTRTGEEIGSMASLETYDNTIGTSVNSVVATTAGLDQSSGTGLGDDDTSGPTGGSGTASSGIEGVIISGHEDRFIRFFDANSGQCTYNMLAHPASISSLSLSPDGRELVSAGHDASLRFWSLEKRTCTQEITSHRIMRGEGVCSVVWSHDGRWVVSGGGDGVVKVFAR